MAWTLVTPSSRGIGFALTRRLLQTTSPSIPIVATCRKDPEGVHKALLSDLDFDHGDRDQHASRLDVQTCDLLDESSISDLAGYCRDRYQKPSKLGSSDIPPHLRVAFMLPGQLHPEKSLAQVDYEKALATLKLNLLSPMILLKHFTPFLPRKSFKPASESLLQGLPQHSAVVGVMSARVGSITDNAMGGWFSYRASKAGVNQLVKTADFATKITSADRACIIGLHPGTVKTELSREFWGNVKKEKLFSPEFSAEKLIGVVNRIGGDQKDINEGRGRCWDWDGKVVPP